ncbi:MAG: hypothetical protein WA663_06455 [Candidatus Acidiferrales bacterium]
MELPASRSVVAGLQGALLLCPLWALAPGARAQGTSGPPPGEEIVANLAAGRVVIAVVKGAILVGTVENPIEAETHVPAPVPLGSERLGVILGAVEWSSPSSGQELARLDKELPHLRSHLVLPSTTPSLQQTSSGSEAKDLEAIGEGLLERLDEVAQGLHAKVDWPANEPVAELIVADYLPDYGPEIWQLTYRMEQMPQEHDYWNTRIERPAYLQLWPPEKGEPRTLVEFDYPPEDAPPSLLELLQRKDPILEKISAADPKMAEVADHFVHGESNKVSAEDATLFLRLALDAIAPRGARETIAVVGEESGFQWILPPPPEPSQPAGKKERPAGAPSLLNPTPPSH